MTTLLLGLGGCATIATKDSPDRDGSLFSLPAGNTFEREFARREPGGTEQLDSELSQQNAPFAENSNSLNSPPPNDMLGPTESIGPTQDALSGDSIIDSKSTMEIESAFEANTDSANLDLETRLELYESVSKLPLRDMPLSQLARYRWEAASSDYEYFYGPRNLVNLATGFFVGAAMANTNFDESISHDFFAENFVDIANEDLTQKLHQFKALGDGYFILPAIGLTAIAQPWLESRHWGQPLGEWGDRSFRAALVGGPLVLVMQNITGGSRPNESHSLSHWEPFQDNNGVSGHAFIGAVPFLTAAQMTKNRWAKVGLFAASMMPAISRINDERHYFSQVFLGWYVAYLATRAVDQTQTGRSGFQIFPTWDQNGFGLQLEKRF